MIKVFLIELNHPTTFDHPTFDYVWEAAPLLINYVYG